MIVKTTIKDREGVDFEPQVQFHLSILIPSFSPKENSILSSKHIVRFLVKKRWISESISHITTSESYIYLSQRHSSKTSKILNLSRKNKQEATEDINREEAEVAVSDPMNQRQCMSRKIWSRKVSFLLKIAIWRCI
jgi:hypothetical protein